VFAAPGFALRLDRRSMSALALSVILGECDGLGGWRQR
jgi:hypothetical protein